jgi:hypothetical protein
MRRRGGALRPGVSYDRFYFGTSLQKKSIYSSVLVLLFWPEDRQQDTENNHTQPEISQQSHVNPEGIMVRGRWQKPLQRKVNCVPKDYRRGGNPEPA